MGNLPNRRFDDLKPYTIGPVTQGYRLSNGKTRGAYRFLVYPKGAYILHMLRMMFYSTRGGDKLGKGWMRLGSGNLSGNSSVELNNIKIGQPIKRVAICSLNDVLALSIQNSK